MTGAGKAKRTVAHSASILWRWTWRSVNLSKRSRITMSSRPFAAGFLGAAIDGAARAGRGDELLFEPVAQIFLFDEVGRQKKHNLKPEKIDAGWKVVIELRDWQEIAVIQ